jgi:hypothetical protein
MVAGCWCSWLLRPYRAWFAADSFTGLHPVLRFYALSALEEARPVYTNGWVPIAQLATEDEMI